jgi:hypothetical protein
LVVSNWSSLASANKILWSLAGFDLMKNYFHSILTPEKIQSVFDVILLFSFFLKKVCSSLQTWLNSGKGFLFVLKLLYTTIKDLRLVV